MIAAPCVPRQALPLTGRCRVRARRRPIVALLCLVSAAGAAAQDAGGTGLRAFYVVPTLSTSLQATNNANLSETDKQSDVILGIQPGIQMGGQTGRVRGFLDYSLLASLSANQSEASTFSNFLAARLNANAVGNWLYLDADASITQQFIDPFGTQSTNPSLNNSNRTEVTTLNVAPYVKGQIAGQADYVGRLFYGVTNSGNSSTSNSTLWGGQLTVDSATRWAKLGWGLDLSYRAVSFDPGIRNSDQLNILSLNYAVAPDLQVSLRGNVETSNLVTIDSETTTGIGGGLRWNPSPRTRLFLEYDQRAFGSSHNYTFDYRTPRTVWALSSSRSLSTGQRNTAGRPPGTAFDLLFAQFATVEPDEGKRRQLVNNFLAANGINPNSSLDTGYLPNQVQLQNQNQASGAWLGMRSTAIVNVYQTWTENLGPLTPALGNRIEWLGYGVTWSHRLTPTATFSLNGNQQRTTQDKSAQETTLSTLTALWTNQVAQRISVALSASYATQTGTSVYDEFSVLANLTFQF